MSESRRVTSTARSIKRFWTLRLIRLFLWLDVLLIALAAVGFAHFHERAALGDQWRFDISREYSLAEEGDLLARVRFSKYAFSAPGGERFEVAVQPFYDAAHPLARILLIAEALSVLGQVFFGEFNEERFPGVSSITVYDKIALGLLVFWLVLLGVYPKVMAPMIESGVRPIVSLLGG